MNNGGGMQVLLADKSLFLPVCYMNRTYEGVCVLLLLLLLYNMSLSCVHIHTAAFLSHCHLWRDSLVHLCAYDGHIESCCGERMCETGLMRTMVLRWHSQTYTYCWLLFLRCYAFGYDSFVPKPQRLHWFKGKSNSNGNNNIHDTKRIQMWQRNKTTKTKYRTVSVGAFTWM